MRPLRLVFLARTPAPAKLLLEQPNRLFDLLTMGVVGFDFTDSECQVVRPPVPAPVFDDQYSMSYSP